MMELWETIVRLEQDMTIFSVVLRILLAAICGGIIGIERGKHGRQAGLRTHVLVCIGATMTSLTGVWATRVMGFAGDPFRIAAQVISGIGFLGAGMIIVKSGNAITGLTTSAGLWTTATIGIALGLGFYEGALLVTLVCIFTAVVLTRVERKSKRATHIFIEINDLSRAALIADDIRELFKPDCYLEIVQPRSSSPCSLGIFVTIPNMLNIRDYTKKIEEMSGVVFAIVES